MTDSTCFPLADADLCVKCGLCLPHCPTYRETQHEADSPRGRIALMQGLVGGVIPLTAAAEQHLDGCLGCRACESVCPAQVPYGSLIDHGRAWLADARPPRTRRARLIGGVLAHRSTRFLVAVKLWLYQRLGLSRLLRRVDLFRGTTLGRLESLLPPLSFPRRIAAATASSTDTRPAVQLFAGCMGEWAERDAADASLRLLEAAGYRVDVPRDQQCCGALHLHAGIRASARSMLRRNLHAFSGTAPIVALASGCAAGLRDAAGFDAGDFVARIQDSFALIAGASQLRFAPLPARVAVQLPCTQRIAPGGGAALLAALGRIPQLEVIESKPDRNCCGAAGSHFLTQPAMADRLLDATLDAIEQSAASLVISANIGCRLHLAAGLRRRGRNIEVLHPAVLLARQLRL